jgi:hypothetical protein
MSRSAASLQAEASKYVLWILQMHQLGSPHHPKEYKVLIGYDSGDDLGRPLHVLIIGMVELKIFLDERVEPAGIFQEHDIIQMT